MSSADNASASQTTPSRKSTAPIATASVFSSPAPPTPQQHNHQRSLARAVYDRRDEYTTTRSMRIKIGSWNVAALPGTERDLKSWFVQGKGVSESLGGLDTDEDEDMKMGGGNGIRKEDVDEDDGWERVETVVHQEKRANKREPTVPLGDPGSLPGNEDVDLYVMGLQEIVDINSVGEALRPFNDLGPAKRWKEAFEDALPEGYQLMAEQQLIGLYMVVYASPSLAPSISSVSTTSVGTGLMGYMGNKGAVVARLVVGEATKIVLVNSHLAAGNDAGQLERRNRDAAQIVQRSQFEPINHGGGIVDDHSEGLGAEHFAFWFGDLNYRIGTLAGNDIRRLLMLHTRNEYDVKQASRKKIDKELDKAGLSSKASAGPSSPEATFSTDSSPFAVGEEGESELDPEDDPASLQTTLASLLPHDQLHEQMRRGKAFHEGWQEGGLKFLPTYKYDVGSVGMFDSSEKKRGPSWCDRILYRTRRDYTAYLEKVKNDEFARRRDAEMTARGLDQDAEDTVLFDYDPETDGAESEAGGGDVYMEDEVSPLSDPGDADALELEYYTSHQRVLSSDHKPLDAIFTLTYEAVDPKLKAAITTEVAKELDRDENEARPTLTLVIDQHDKDGDQDGLYFGPISFDVPETRSITIANTGGVTAHLGLVQDLVPGPFRRWLRVQLGDETTVAGATTSTEYSIEPGDTMTAAFTMHVKLMDEVRALNYGEAQLEDVRVLRVKDGRDHFITMRGEWQNSCFGLSLEKLIRVPEEGVRSCSLGAMLDEQQVKWSAPRELFRLTETLEECLNRAIPEWAMKEEDGKPPPWESAGWPFTSSTWTLSQDKRNEIAVKLRENLDTGSAFDLDYLHSAAEKVEVLAELLLAFLDSIEGGIVDDLLWTSLSKKLQDREKTKKPADQEQMRALILDEVSQSPIRSVVFSFTTFMLARIASEVAPFQSSTASPKPAAVPVAAATGFIGRVRGASGSQVDPRAEKRREVERKFAEAFAAVMFKTKEEKGKEKKAGDERRKGILAVFFHAKSDDGASS